METENTKEIEVKTTYNKCSSCGGKLVFDAESGELKCMHCGTIKDIDDDYNSVDRELTDEVIKSHAPWTEGLVFECENCGAKEVIGKNEITKSCAFCGSSNIIAQKELAGIKPDSVIPFSVTKKDAAKRFRAWIKSRFFAPSYLKKRDVAGEFIPIYSSCWSFSASTKNDYRGTLGRAVQSGKHTSVKWFRVSGNISQDYSNHFIKSGRGIDDQIFARLKPFDLRKLCVYRQEYLAGVISEHYFKTIDICFGEFEKFIKRDIRRKIINDHNADRVKQLSINTEYSNKKFKYILLPLYVGHFSFKNKKYKVYLNGSSGKVAGSYPISARRVLATIIATCAVIGGFIWLFDFLAK